MHNAFVSKGDLESKIVGIFLVNETINHQYPHFAGAEIVFGRILVFPMLK